MRRRSRKKHAGPPTGTDVFNKTQGYVCFCGSPKARHSLLFQRLQVLDTSEALFFFELPSTKEKTVRYVKPLSLSLSLS